jgi:hypothetical protein
MRGSAIEAQATDVRDSFRDGRGGHGAAPDRSGSVARVEYLSGIGWVSRDFWPQSEKRSPR